MALHGHKGAELQRRLKMLKKKKKVKGNKFTAGLKNA